MLLTVETPPAAEPVTLAEAKAHLRVLHASEDALITRLIAAVRSTVERTLGRALIPQPLNSWLRASPAPARIPPPRPPLRSVASITYRDLDDANQTLAADSYVVIGEDLLRARVERAAGASWPATFTTPKAVKVTYDAGYGGASTDVPEDLRNALLLMVEHLYYNRGASSDARLEAIPFGVDAMLDPFRTHGWI